MFTRRLEDVTTQFPDVVAAVRDETTTRDAIIEAEVVAYDPDTGNPVPFQELSKRIERKSDVDVLVTETTYGKPEYIFEAQGTLEQRIVDWLSDSYETPVILFGYTLGRAQELELLVKRSDRERLFVTGAIESLNETVADAHGIRFNAERYDQDVTLGAGDALVLPARTNKLSFSTTSSTTPVP